MEPILDVKNLKQHFKVNRNFTVKAVDGIDFYIAPGETYGLVGESGSGKSTTGRSIIRLYDPTDGTITFCGRTISGKLSKEDRKFLHTNMQMIFQDPMACLIHAKKSWISWRKALIFTTSIQARKREQRKFTIC
ncbi:ATP-binding cassette domain-containing protein [Dubosiella newyorkensis]|uniref:ATP-binding cassette domain-containing protein n=1 Tax=Dubosiella newyorkensis TaxID=1862672 RepID=UPI003F66BBB8